MARGLWIAAPASGSGKTVVTLALLRHLRNQGHAAASLKAGPDYIDPAFHALASGRPCRNLDHWAMQPETLAGIIASGAKDAALIVGEGVMGLFDGAASGSGSTADLVALTGWPVILVVDVRGMGASAAALVEGFCRHRTDLAVAGVIFNRVGSDFHLQLLKEACAALPVRILGGLRRDQALELPDRHLGLVQAGEHADLDGFLDRAAERLATQIDIAALLDLAGKTIVAVAVSKTPPIPPLGQRITVARDVAFAFSYPHVLEGWKQAGAEISFFSPLADELPDERSTAIYLPGGYPELHAGRLAGNRVFLSGLRRAAMQGMAIYGECGGYMALGEGLIDADGACHVMAGLLPLETSFEAPKLSLGYRKATLCATGPLGAAGAEFRGHEFHYAVTTRQGDVEPLFKLCDSRDAEKGLQGLRAKTVAGSFLHLIDRQD